LLKNSHLSQLIFSVFVCSSSTSNVIMRCLWNDYVGEPSTAIAEITISVRYSEKGEVPDKSGGIRNTCPVCKMIMSRAIPQIRRHERVTEPTYTGSPCIGSKR